MTASFMHLQQAFTKEHIDAWIKDLSGRLSADFDDEIHHGNFALIGIQTRGVVIAEKIALLLKQKFQRPILTGSLGITLYRDDYADMHTPRILKTTMLDFSIDRKVVILVDDVLFTGRTVRAALNEIMDFGRPSIIRLLVLINRKLGRQLPIQPDYAARNENIPIDGKILVRFSGIDPDIEDGVYIPS